MSTNLRHLFPEPGQPGDSLANERLRRARITAGTVLDPARPAQGAFADALAQPPVTGRLAPPSLPVEGLRLVPLDGFFWGGSVRGTAGATGTGATPRVRGDHVLILVQGGCVTVELPRAGHPVLPGRLAFVPAGTAFAMQPGGDCRGLVLLVPFPVAQDLSVALPPAYRCGLPHPADAALIEPALRSLAQGSPRGPTERIAAACQLGLLCVALERLVPPSPEPAAAGHLTVETGGLTERFLAYAESRLDGDLTIADMACDLGCSAAQLDRACRATRGRSPLELIYALRLERAAQLLRDTDQPITQIAQELGYSGIGHFTRCFVAGTGQRPDHFRATAADARTE